MENLQQEPVYRSQRSQDALTAAAASCASSVGESSSLDTHACCLFSEKTKPRQEAVCHCKQEKVESWKEDALMEENQAK